MKLAFLALSATLAGALFLSQLEKERTEPPRFTDPLVTRAAAPLPQAQDPLGPPAPTINLSLPLKPELPPREALRHWNRITLLNQCWREETCAEALPDGDPSERQFAIRDRILEEIDWFLAHSTRSPVYAERTLKASHLLLELSDEMVQAKALDLAATFPTDPRTAEILTRHVVPRMVDTDLARKVGAEFSRQLRAGLGNEEEILSSIGSTILHGGNFASVEMAKVAVSILSERERPLVEKWRAGLPEGSERKAILRERLRGE